MAYTIRWEGDIIIAECTGVLTPRDLAGMVREAATLESLPKRVPHRIIDLTGVSDARISGGDVRAIAEQRRIMPFPNRFKSALVAPERVLYAYARMFQILNTHPQMTIALFPTLAAAMEWIVLPGDDPPEVPWEPSSK